MLLSSSEFKSLLMLVLIHHRLRYLIDLFLFRGPYSSRTKGLWIYEEYWMLSPSSTIWSMFFSLIKDLRVPKAFSLLKKKINKKEKTNKRFFVIFPVTHLSNTQKNNEERCGKGLILTSTWYFSQTKDGFHLLGCSSSVWTQKQSTPFPFILSQSSQRTWLKQPTPYTQQPHQQAPMTTKKAQDPAACCPWGGAQHPWGSIREKGKKRSSKKWLSNISVTHPYPPASLFIWKTLFPLQ